MKDKIKEIFEESIKTKEKTLEYTDEIEKAAIIMIDSLKNNNKILICGNGGSAADAQHMAGELVGRFEKERKGLPCIALTTDTSILTAWINDYNYDSVFSRQIEALGNEGDILIGITTSGNSKNVIEAVEKAKQKNMKTIILSGKDGGKIREIDTDVNIVIPSNNTARIQESHITIIHMWCKIIEDEIFK